MTSAKLPLEDLILSSRSLTIEEKQNLLKQLDTLEKDKKVKLQQILEEEYLSLQKMDQLTLTAIQQFTQTLQTIL